MLEIFSTGPLSNNVILLFCERQREAVIIDPALQSFGIVSDYVQQLKLRVVRLLLTHSHWDHMGDLFRFKEKYPEAPVCVHNLDVTNVERPGSDGLIKVPGVKGVSVDIRWQGEEIFQVGDVEVKVMHTPGHTPGSVCYYAKGEGLLLSGDTLFRGCYGKVSFPGSDPEKMWASLKKLYTLPFDTQVIPGHGEGTLIGEENWMPNAKNLFG